MSKETHDNSSSVESEYRKYLRCSNGSRTSIRRREDITNDINQWYQHQYMEKD